MHYSQQEVGYIFTITFSTMEVMQKMLSSNLADFVGLNPQLSLEAVGWGHFAESNQIKCLSFSPISHQVLVQTPTTNYTVQDYQRLYSDIGFEDGWLMRQDTEPLVTDLTPPGVAIHCLYGSGIDTSEAFQYTDKFPDVEPTVVYGDGDGTVNLMSAVQCKRWIGRQKQPVKLMELPGNEHVNMLLNFTTVAYIKRVLFSP